MERKKKHKVKKERSEKSKVTHSSYKDRDLSQYVHDRVELLQQTFSVMKPRDILALAPESISHLDLDKIKELCLEELLGISTKRLNSVLDGTGPPSDTESSDSSDRLPYDAISLDSISSDEGNLSPKTSSSKSKKKRCKNKEKPKKDKRKEKSSGKEGEGKSQAGSAGLTVLELLELQARARAIKAQLLAEQQRKGEAAEAATTSEVGGAASAASDDDDVLIKEEPPEVVELDSSDDEPPNKSPKKEAKEPEIEATKQQLSEDGNKIVTKRNDLTIIVPKPQTTRRIKLKRNNVIAQSAPENKEQVASGAAETNTQNVATTPVQQNTIETSNKEAAITSTTVKEKRRKKTKKKKKARDPEEAEASDQDEITLQLSDSEKMDLLEDFDRKSYDKVSSSSSEETDDSHSESSSRDAAELVIGNTNSKDDLVSSSKDQENPAKANVEKLHENTDSTNEDLLKNNDMKQSPIDKTDKTLIYKNDHSQGEVSTTEKASIIPDENLELRLQNVGQQSLVTSTKDSLDDLQKLKDQSVTDKIESSLKPEKLRDEKEKTSQMLEEYKCQDQITEVSQEKSNNDQEIHERDIKNDTAEENETIDANPEVVLEIIAKDENTGDCEVYNESSSLIIDPDNNECTTDIKNDGEKSSESPKTQNVVSQQESTTKEFTNEEESEKKSHKKKKKKDKKAKKKKNKQ